MSLRRIIFIAIGLLIYTAAGSSAEIYTDTPEVVDTGRKYLFYMHGAWIEMKGLHKPHPQYGLYEYDKILEALSLRGFAVISEVRSKAVSMGQYIDKTVRQVHYLLEQGVPEENITVAGHSKGGYMTLKTAAILKKDKVNFVIMAGCGRKGTMFRWGYEGFLKKSAPKLCGRMLSIYDIGDRASASCQEAFSAAPAIESEEVVLNTGKGHGLFYSPNSSWVLKLAEWAGL